MDKNENQTEEQTSAPSMENQTETDVGRQNDVNQQNQQYYNPYAQQPSQGAPYQQPYGNYQQNYNGQPYDNYGQNYNNQPYGNYQQNYNGQPYGNYQQGYSGQPYDNYGQNYNNQSYHNYGQNYNGQSGNYQQNYNNQQAYGYYGNQPYANPQNQYQQQAVLHGPVTNVFYYILMALTLLSFILTFIMAKYMLSAIDFEAFANGNSSYSSIIAETSALSVSGGLSLFNSFLSIAILVISIVDIVQVHKQNYPIMGLVLFTIFFKPGYFIWRAYVLKQPKLIPVLYTALLVLLYVAYFMWCFFYTFSMVSSVM